MAFGFKKRREDPDAPPANGVHAMALVTETRYPIENVPWTSHGQMGLARTRILVNLGNGPVTGLRDLRLDPAHWLVEGITIPVIIDPSDPNRYVIEWERMPSMAQRAAANEPALVDPMGTRLRVWDALASAGYRVLAMDEIAARIADQTAASMKMRLDGEPQDFARQLAAVTDLSAPPGWRRALVLIATTTATFEGSDYGQIPHREIHGRHSVVLSVQVPGQPPYALFIPAFDHQRRIYDSNRPGLPALVSITDPTDVRVQWDEMQTARDQRQELQQRSQEFKAVEAEHRHERREQHQAALDGAAAARASDAPLAAPRPPPMSPQVRAAMTASAKRALTTADAETRQGLIDYYRSIGIDLEANG